MASDLDAEEIRRLLALEPNATCGYVRSTFTSKKSIAKGGLQPPFAAERPLGSQSDVLHQIAAFVLDVSSPEVINLGRSPTPGECASGALRKGILGKFPNAGIEGECRAGCSRSGAQDLKAKSNPTSERGFIYCRRDGPEE
jgi:hypothetical protein